MRYTYLKIIFNGSTIGPMFDNMDDVREYLSEWLEDNAKGDLSLSAEEIEETDETYYLYSEDAVVSDGGSTDDSLVITHYSTSFICKTYSHNIADPEDERF